MPVEMVEDILDQVNQGRGKWVHQHWREVTPVHYNEILLYPHFAEFLALIRKYNLLTSVASNGLNLTPDKVDLINKYQDVVQGVTLNIPAFDAETWSKATGFNIKLHDKLISNLDYASKNLIHKKYKDGWVIQVNSATEASIADGVVLLKNAPKFDTSTHSGEMRRQMAAFKKAYPEALVLGQDSLLDRSGTLDTLGVLSNKAWLDEKKKTKKVVGCSNMGDRTTEWLHISASGDVFLCCNDFDFETVFGNVKETSLSSIWKSRQHWDMVREAQNEFCTRCSQAIWG